MQMYSEAEALGDEEAWQVGGGWVGCMTAGPSRRAKRMIVLHDHVKDRVLDGDDVAVS
jgi:hypothetical protein